jgi:hypothetical protein
MKAQVIPLCNCNSFYGKLEIGELSINNNSALFIPYYCNSCDNKMKRYGFIERTTGNEIYGYNDFMDNFILYCYIEPNMIYSLSNEKHFCPKCKKVNLTFLT